MSPDEFFLLTNPLPDPVCMISTAGNIIAANDAAARFFETDLNIIQNKSLYDLATDNRDKIRQHLRNWSRSRDMIPGPLNLRINNSEIRSCNCNGSLLRPKTANSPAAIILRIERREHFSKNFTVLNKKVAQLQKEIVVRQRTEQALAKSKAEFEAMFNSIPDAVMFVDMERRIIMNNPAARTLFGYSDEELRGNKTEMVYADKTQFHAQGHRRYNPKTTDNGAYEIKYQRKDGSVFWSETVGTKVTNENGEVIGYIGLVRDISERKQAEEEIKKYRDHLEELVKQRTIALENSNKELESYSYSIAHDLRSPLRSITSFSQILMEDAADKLSTDENNYLERIVSSATRMANLIDDILELSRVARSEIQLEDINLSTICLDISDALNLTNQDRTVSWEIERDIVVNGDYHLLYNVLNNLLENAWKFTAQNKHAKIEFGQLKNTKENIYFIRDNGVGFDMRYVKKLFGLFQRLHRSDEFEGTGVGLATVERIIQRHNGWVKIEGEVNKGTTVYFSIPDKAKRK